jgi:Uma2 family endonuclease
MPGQQTLVSVEAYLAGSFEGLDREFVDGRIVERGGGELEHSWLQGELILYFGSLRTTANLFALPEQRVQVKASRFRVPDVTVFAGKPRERILRTPPFLCIEIVSPEDRASQLQEKIDDYLSFGVPYVWIIDPRLRHGSTYTNSGMRPGLSTENPKIELDLAPLLID